ncbi:hypothetical protein MVEG_06288 [Podila verticillata NRRL 6337]|nr:hypothetical protein MVEG_06288 [Podila verticillata NRRL 6337]
MNMDDATQEHETFDLEPLPTPADFSGIKPTAQYQARALARRALSFHSRRRITNGICLIIWPILMVLLNFSLARLIPWKGTGPRGVFRMCVNEVDPLRTRSAEFNKRILLPDEIAYGFNASFYPHITRNFDDDDMDPGYMPCVRWFGESHPDQPPYANGNHTSLDTYYVPSDLEWLERQKYEDLWLATVPPEVFGGPINFYPAILQNYAINQTLYYSYANADIAKVLGASPNVTQIIFSETWPPTNTNASVIYNNSTAENNPAAVGSGIFGAVPVRYLESRFFTLGGTPGQMFPGYNRTYVAMPQFVLIDDPEDAAPRLEYDAYRRSAGYQSYGMGSVRFEALDLSGAGSLKATMQMVGISTEKIGIRQLVAMSQLNSAMVKHKYGGKYILSQGIRALPYEYDYAQDNGANISLASSFLFPFALSFLMPIFVLILVEEKENRLRIMMAMNGLKSSSYYLAHYVEFMTMQLLLTLIFALSSAAIKSSVIGRTSSGLLVVLFLLWAHVQVCFAFAIAACISKTRRAAILVNSFVALSAILGSISDRIFVEDAIPIAWLIHPSFAFYHIISVATLHANMVNMTYPLSFVDFTSGSTILYAVILMAAESVFFLLLTFYIDAVATSDYGVTRPWYFFITDLFKVRGHRRDPESSLRVNGPFIEDSTSIEGGDADVQEELERVRTVYDPEQTPLLLDNLFHRYPGKVVPALRGMSLGVEKNTVLGLLGPNGAGKSTMIHLLTGLYKPTSGTAYVAGANIDNQMSLVHLRTGVCPQHDILWDELTIADHLLFYSRLRGVPPALEQQAVAYAIASVCLTKFRDRQVKSLSGGERRRVSIAISMLGDNRVIFLDEPTTGLDPAIRRIIWDVVNRIKVDRTVVLTTHSMEEADVLSDRIAIMTEGQLRCLGTSLHLKELYGSGFRLSVTSKPGRLQEACQGIEEKVLSGRPYKRTDKFTNATVYDFNIGQVTTEGGATKGELSSIFKSLLQREQFPDVEDWGISQTTLEDVFIKIATDTDANLRIPRR